MPSALLPELPPRNTAVTAYTLQSHKEVSEATTLCFREKGVDVRHYKESNKSLLFF